MTQSKSSSGLKALAGLLGVALIGVAAYTVTLYKDKQDTTQKLTEQKELVIDELNSLKSDYDKAIADADAADEELIEARGRIEKYIDSVKSMKADISVLWKYRNQVNVLKKEREVLLAQNDSLRRSNSLISFQRDSTMVELTKQVVFSDSLVEQNTQLAKVVEIGATLSLSRLAVDAVIERSSGKLVSTQRSSRTDKLKVCFTIASNKIALAGDKQFYIQITGPSGAIMGAKAEATTEDKTITYSMLSNFYFENTALDVCEYLSKSSAGFTGGNYEIKIFDTKLNELGSTKFSLK
ncbi:hypothetical protein [Imtechella halotolerans]|uniref:Uncharacterized protein n=1 Tax=Imtechella halotolerans K1 TaxID=946077 RepID=I0W8I0_9FLAO|nr:hypothetical protein [Imtechella halotolerans]EID72696.1 hypothetical protein W5A_11224 [Imtechella halotolerans K1]WMQ64618.1 hypothetical protein PT603_06440 [Imtechella halotolerans]